MRIFAFIILFALCIGGSRASAQQNLTHNHFFLNPSLYNPSYFGANRYTEVFLNYRKQWAGINGAPSTAALNFHLPFNHKTALGITAYQDQAGVLTSTTGLASFSYQLYFGQKTAANHYLAFGISAGVTHSYVNVTSNDPATASNNTSSLDGQFGFNYRFKNLNISFAIPRIFESYVTSDVGFNEPGIKQVKTTISSVSYLININQRISFEPLILYRTYDAFSPQYEACGILRFNKIGWIGGSYKQDYGASAFLGFTINDKIKLGYAYEFAAKQSDNLSSGSHELQLVLRIGKKQKTRPVPEEKVKEEEVTEEVVREEVEPNPIEEKQNVTQTSPPMVTPPVVKEIQVLSKEDSAAVEKPVVVLSNGSGLEPGHYVVVGAFRSKENAATFRNTLKRAGYPAESGFQTEKDLYIVYMKRASTLEEAQVLRAKYRAMSRYSLRDTWILSIE